MDDTRTPFYMTPEDRETKLPAWAQDKLRVLRMRLKEAHRERAEMSPENGPTNTVADVSRPMRDGQQPFYLPNGTEVRFTVENLDRNREGSIQCRVKDGRLEVHGSDPFTIFTSSSNLIRMTTVR